MFKLKGVSSSLISFPLKTKRRSYWGRPILSLNAFITFPILVVGRSLKRISVLLWSTSTSLMTMCSVVLAWTEPSLWGAKISSTSPLEEITIKFHFQQI